ncbi:MAG: hypothetical protein ACFFKA_17880, partial [Candidatus Thorarchaeota archaeon]
MILEKNNLRVIVTDNEERNLEQIEIYEEHQWVPILKNANKHSTLIFRSKTEKFSKLVSFEKRKKKKLYYNLIDADISLNLDYCLEENNVLHIRYKLR